jgi:hypothetical protein
MRAREATASTILKEKYFFSKTTTDFKNCVASESSMEAHDGDARAAAVNLIRIRASVRELGSAHHCPGNTESFLEFLAQFLE